MPAETLEDHLRRATRNFTARLPEDQAITLGRGIRYFGEALLAAWYGEAAIAKMESFVHDHGMALLVTVAAVTVGGGLWIWYAGRRRGIDSSSGTPV